MDRSFLRRIRKLSIRTRRQTGADLLGSYRSTVKGQGLEYVESRAYEPGDDIRHIDWKVTARKGIPHTKRFSEERQLRLLLCIDTSHSMRFGGAERSKLQTALQAACILAYTGIREGDTVEFMLFDETAWLHLGPNRSENDFWHSFGELEKIPDDPYQNPVRGTDFSQLGESIMKMRRKPQVAFLISDMNGSNLDNRQLRTVARRTDLYPLQVVATPEQSKLPFRANWLNRETDDSKMSLQAVKLESLFGRAVGVLDEKEDLIQALSRYLHSNTGRRRR